MKTECEGILLRTPPKVKGFGGCGFDEVHREKRGRKHGGRDRTFDAQNLKMDDF